MRKDRELSERTSVTLSQSLARRLMVEARTTDRSVSGIVREALERYFSEQQAPALPSFAGIGDSSHVDTAERAEDILASRFNRSRRK